jgi:hypothetical protein
MNIIQSNYDSLKNLCLTMI